MAHEILSAKLNELDGKIGRLHSRIHIIKSEDPSQLAQAVLELRKECKEEIFMLQNQLQYSNTESMRARLQPKTPAPYTKILIFYLRI